VAAATGGLVEAGLDVGDCARGNHLGQGPEGIGWQIGHERASRLAKLDGHQERLSHRGRGSLAAERARADERYLDPLPHMLGPGPFRALDPPDDVQEGLVVDAANLSFQLET
jgi:hypothetical protein